jgi:hypothetical protein
MRISFGQSVCFKLLWASFSLMSLQDTFSFQCSAIVFVERLLVGDFVGFTFNNDRFSRGNFYPSPLFNFLISLLVSQILQQGLGFLETHGPTIVICSVVFGTVSFINASMTRDSNPNASVISKGPRPKWEVLRAMNYIVLAIFIGSISYATINYHQTFTQGATPAFIAMAILWCLCLGYFFGFFGISFLDQETLQRSPSSLGLSEVKMTFPFSLPLPLLTLVRFKKKLKK